jgi:hypothetical protein
MILWEVGGCYQVNLLVTTNLKLSQTQRHHLHGGAENGSRYKGLGLAGLW